MRSAGFFWNLFPYSFAFIRGCIIFGFSDLPDHPITAITRWF
jgi:hypothetical protein